MKIRLFPIRRGFAFLFVLVLVSACTSTPSSQAPEGEATRVDSPQAALERLAVTNLQGETQSLVQAASGRVMLVDVWATWCKACKTTHPQIEALRKEMPEVFVVGLSAGEDKGTVERYLESRPLSYPIYLDPDFELSEALGVSELPLFLVVSSEGKILRRAHSIDDDVKARLRGALETPAGADGAGEL